MIPCGKDFIVVGFGMGAYADFVLCDLFLAFFYWE
jgi:hypothetical protein